MVHARGVHDGGSARRPSPRGPTGATGTPARVAGHWLAALAGVWIAGLADSALATEPAPDAVADATADEPATDEPRDAATVDEPSEAATVEGAKTDEPRDAATADAAKTDEPSDAATVDEPKSDEPSDAAKADAEPSPASPAPRPPRIDGTYLGGTMLAGVGLIRVNDFDTPGGFAAFGGTFTVGQMVFPWLGLGLHGGGGGMVRSKDAVRQKVGQGHLGVQFKFVPLPKRRIPLSLLASFGFGGGAVRQEGIAKRSGYGGAQFGAAVRYELFPWASKRRPYRGGGFGLGPELGWVGFTPAATGRPMSNVVYLALSATFYFGS